MNGELKDLMMPGARFRTEICYREVAGSPFLMDGVPVEPGPDGADAVRFMIRTNRGEAEGAVDEIASTGEISRIALALKKITNVGKPGSVLVFDELDAGVGADLAGPIAEKLLDLSSYYQIICITHLAQIAAAGKRHLVVSKRSVKDRTYADVSGVDGEDRKREIARMLGGEEGSDKRMALAAEMLEKADSHRRRLNVRP
jgi:DNA repair protein RecN (Recombination protein N)